MSRFLEIDPDAMPTPMSLTQAEERGKAELRVCSICGLNATLGERRLIQNGSNEAWTHPYH